VIASCGYVTRDFDPADVPMDTEGRDRDDDVIVHTAMLCRASVMLSDNTRRRRRALGCSQGRGRAASYTLDAQRYARSR